MTDITRAAVALTLGLTVATAAPPGAAGQGLPLGTPIPDQPIGQAADDTALTVDAFLAHQLAFPRVADARATTDQALRARFREKALDYPAREIFIRVFKHERILELWARSDPDDAFTLVTAYPVCALPGQLGPKQRMGDLQVPEGFYFIDEFNPRSSYHLSLRVDYPNIADRMRRRALALGGDIFIHGGCETVGCVPIEDANIRELYWIAAQATDAGQSLIPVHIFPARLDQSRLQWLEETFRPEADLLEFWHNLAQGYLYFEHTRHVPWVTVARDGRYIVPEPAHAAANQETHTTEDQGAEPDPDPGAEPAGETGQPGGPIRDI
jgi:murein L,D-transpeptidase YafK